MVDTQYFEYRANVGVVILATFGVDENIVEVDYNKSADQLSKDVEHECLEGRGRVTESERDDVVFEFAELAAERGFPLVPSSNPKEMVGVGKIELSKYLGF